MVAIPGTGRTEPFVVILQVGHSPILDKGRFNQEQERAQFVFIIRLHLAYEGSRLILQRICKTCKKLQSNFSTPSF